MMKAEAAFHRLAERFSSLSPEQRQSAYTKIRAEGLGMECFPVLGRSESLRLQCPASYAQRRQWFLWELDRESTAYHISGALRLKGELDVAALRASFSALVRRHESLRTVFVADEQGLAQQHIRADGEMEFALIELSQRTVAEREAFARVEAGRLQATPFDLGRGPLLRVGLIRLSALEHLLVVVMHHIISDGWSMQVLVDEFVAHYRAALEGREAALSPLPIQYADYAQWQLQWLEAGEKARQLEYWKAQLDTEHPILQLPVDRPRRADGRYRAARWTMTVPASLAPGLRSRAQEENTTVFVTLLAGLQALLHRYTGQDDIRIGVPIANRHRVETEGVIGFFVNTQVLRNRVGGRDSLTEVLARTREAALGAQAHQDLPFEHLVEALQPERSIGTSPLFQVMFNYLKNDTRALQSLPGLQLEPYELGAKAAQFELTVEAVEQAGGGLRLSFIYAEALFEQASIERLAGHYLALLEALATAPDQAVADVELLSEGEQIRLQGWGENRERYEAAEPIQRLIEAQAAANPDAVAVIFGEEQLSYGELTRRANRLAHHLIGLGVGPEVRVGIAVERSLELVVGLLGILKAGGAYVPLDPAYPADRLGYMMEDSGIGLLLTQSQVSAQLPVKAGLTVLELDGPYLSGEPESAPEVPVSGENLAYVIYTSGSTGRPKGAAVQHGALINCMRWMQAAYCLQSSDVVLHKAPFGFDVSVWEIFWPLSAGVSLVVAKPEEHRDPERIIARIREHGITTVNFVPAMLQAFLAHEGIERETHLRHILCGGEAMPAGVQEVCARRLPGAGLYNLYGPTETTIHVTHWTCRADGRHLVPIGAPIADIQTYVLDAELNLAMPGVAGELYVGGVGLARGYLNRPGLSSERFVAHPFDPAGGRLYRTGDLVRWNAEGELEYLGRIDHQVKIRGFRIELGEVEAQLLAQPEVREAVVVADEGSGGARLVGYVSAQAGREIDVAELRMRLGQTLPDYMVPSVLMVLGGLPLNANGKIDRKALPLPEMDRTAIHEAPQGQVEVVLAGIWAEVLGVERIGRQDSFFELGGHSLLALRLLQRVRETFGLPKLALAELFKRHRLVDQASLACRMPSDAVDIVVLTEGGQGVPLYCFPGLIVNSSEYRYLAEALAGDRPVYAFVSHALTSQRWKCHSIERLAAGYAAYIRCATQGGPCALLGWSLGGDLAFETARQLAVDLPVRFLGMVDVAAPTPPSPPALTSAQQGEARARLDSWCTRSEMAEQWQALLNRLPSVLLDQVLADALVAEGDLPLDGPGYASKEYLQWALLDAQRMLMEYDYREVDVQMDVWLAADARRRRHVSPRDWGRHGTVRATTVVPESEHLTIVRSAAFVTAVKDQLRQLDNLAVTER